MKIRVKKISPTKSPLWKGIVRQIDELIAAHGGWPATNSKLNTKNSKLRKYIRIYLYTFSCHPRRLAKYFYGLTAGLPAPASS